MTAYYLLGYLALWVVLGWTAWAERRDRCQWRPNDRRTR